MGVIATRTSFRAGGRPQILVVPSQSKLRKFWVWPWARQGWAGIIAAQGVDFHPPADLPCVMEASPEQCASLEEGDVVLLDKTGGITVLYKNNSPHNSLLATNRCNCLCVMCPQPPTADPSDLLQNNLDLITLLDAKKTPYLGITGGEPTLLGQDLIRLVEACRARLPQTMLTLLTNGRKLKDLEFARALVQAGYPYMVIEIPLFADNDTEHDAIMAAKGSFYETIQGLHNLARLGHPVGLRTVLHALTVPRLTQYAEFIYRNLPFVGQVAFMGMETRGLASENLEKLWIDPFDYQDQLTEAARYLIRRMVPVSIYNHQLCLLPPRLWPFARQSITGWKQAYPPLCRPCTRKESCGGIFCTGEKHSAHLHPL
jgi:His-Xaa-Ser system radical SAM maturase HxsC